MSGTNQGTADGTPITARIVLLLRGEHRTDEVDARRPQTEISWARHTDNASQVVAQRAETSQVLDLFWEDNWRINVYAGEIEVRPPENSGSLRPSRRPLLNAIV